MYQRRIQQIRRTAHQRRVHARQQRAQVATEQQVARHVVHTIVR